MLKNRGWFSAHVLTTACASAPQDNKKTRMCKFQMSKPHEQKPESCVGAYSAGESVVFGLSKSAAMRLKPCGIKRKCTQRVFCSVNKLRSQFCSCPGVLGPGTIGAVDQ